MAKLREACKQFEIRDHGSAARRRARYETIHKVAQYKNSGAIQIGIMNIGGQPRFERAPNSSLSNTEERPLHESIVKEYARNAEAFLQGLSETGYVEGRNV